MVKIVTSIYLFFILGCVLCDASFQSIQNTAEKCVEKYQIDLNSEATKRYACVGFCNLGLDTEIIAELTVGCSKLRESNIHIVESDPAEKDKKCIEKYGVDIYLEANKKYKCTVICKLGMDDSSENAVACAHLANASSHIMPSVITFIMCVIYTFLRN